jgi:predicted RNA-binding protein with PIN domain
MIKKYIIDGNNLIGKISDLWALQQKDKQMSRIKLTKILDQYFSRKNVKVSLHFDGHAADAIPSGNLQIFYSNNVIADTKIRHEIENSNNPKTIAVISSDHGVQDCAKVNSCKIIKSEEFSKLLKQKKNTNKEDEITKSISTDEIKKIFGVE